MIPNPEENRLVQGVVEAHRNALEHFRKGAAAAKKAGEYLNALMELKGFKTRDEVWRHVLESSDLTEETFSYRSCASYMKIDADWSWMEALLGDELFSMTQNGFLAEASKLNAKSRRKKEPTPPLGGEGNESATGDDADNPQAGAEGADGRTAGTDDDADDSQAGANEGVGGQTGEPNPGAADGDSSTNGRSLDPVFVLTALCNTLNEIVESDLKEEELPEIENLIQRALELIERLKNRLTKK